MISIDYSCNGVNVSAAVATDREAANLARAINLAYGVQARISFPAKPVHPFKTGDKIHVKGWKGEWYVISTDGQSLWLRPWLGMGEPKGVPVCLCEAV